MIVIGDVSRPVTKRGPWHYRMNQHQERRLCRLSCLVVVVVVGGGGGITMKGKLFLLLNSGVAAAAAANLP